MWELDYKESLSTKELMLSNCVWRLENPLGFKDIKPVSPKGNQPWIFNGRTDTETEAPILWPPDAMSQLLGKDPDAGKDWRQQKKGGSSGLRWLVTITDSMDMDLSKLWKTVEDRGAGMLQSMGSQSVGNNLTTEQQYIPHGEVTHRCSDELFQQFQPTVTTS